MTLKKTLLACEECGCTDCEVSAWIDANTGEVSDTDGPLDDAFCPQCSGETTLVEVPAPVKYEVRAVCVYGETNGVASYVLSDYDQPTLAIRPASHFGVYEVNGQCIGDFYGPNGRAAAEAWVNKLNMENAS